MSFLIYTLLLSLKYYDTMPCMSDNFIDGLLSKLRPSSHWAEFQPLFRVQECGGGRQAPFRNRGWQSSLTSHEPEKKSPG